MKKHSTFVLSLLALVLIMTAAVRPAMAYFTANSRADGAVPLKLGFKTDIEESVHDLEKTVVIKNIGDNPVWVRAIAYVGSTFTLEVSGWGSPAGSGTWVYYGAQVPPGGQADPLSVKVTGIPTSDEYIMTSFNVSVQYESIPVEYDADGNPKTPTAEDWINNKLDTGTTTP